MGRHHSIIVFADIRGFTKASRDTAFHDGARKFLHDFRALREQHFPNVDVCKMTGDGFMVVCDIVHSDRVRKLSEILNNAARFTSAFDSLTKETSDEIAVHLDLSLGWGISRGITFEIGGDDRFGSSINLAARLCDCARPKGFVVSAENFSDMPACAPDGGWHLSKRHLAGHHDPVPVWESDSPHNEFQAREIRREEPEVHVAGVCLRRFGTVSKVLILRRSARRRLYPGLWEGCGGQLRRSETFGEGVARHFLTDVRVAVRPIEDCHIFYHIREPNEPTIPGVRMVCEWQSGEPVLGANYSEFRWASVEELQSMPVTDFIPGLRDQVLELATRWAAQ